MQHFIHYTDPALSKEQLKSPFLVIVPDQLQEKNIEQPFLSVYFPDALTHSKIAHQVQFKPTSFTAGQTRSHYYNDQFPSVIWQAPSFALFLVFRDYASRAFLFNQLIQGLPSALILNKDLVESVFVYTAQQKDTNATTYFRITGPENKVEAYCSHRNGFVLSYPDAEFTPDYLEMEGIWRVLRFSNWLFISKKRHAAFNNVIVFKCVSAAIAMNIMKNFNREVIDGHLRSKGILSLTRWTRLRKPIDLPNTAEDAKPGNIPFTEAKKLFFERV